AIIASFFPEELKLPTTSFKGLLNIKNLAGLSAFFLMYIIGVIDDIRTISYKKKLSYQIIAAFLIIASGTWIHNMCGVFGVYEIPVYIGMPLTVLFIIFIINSINFIDGIDGLSSGISIIITIVFIILFYSFGRQLILLLAFTMLGMLVSFIRYNLFGVDKIKYKIFMGDSGSLLIGTIISYFAISGSQLGINSNILSVQETFIISASAILVPCLDTLRVVCHRIKCGQSMFHPDKNHIHHKLMATGLSQRKILVTILSLVIFFILLNWLLFQLININFILIVDTIIYIIIHKIITKKIKTFLKSQNHQDD
ncbi:MAG: undecaprenyl/decaprenyl-phosphate alpha-N-acetylglucosaminyl 1-phosphate transferase, partial [Prolixibacteraceae bacterium]|nr:undecaprenyl/decaprenyl-phosphate alpha-N-acetylglucosaminyl 1-phosphate transferase [Prolixibacteraceae bacterium]